MLVGWFLINFLFGLTLIIGDRLRQRRAIKFASLQVADSEKLCKGPHSWIFAQIGTAEGPAQVRVCRACGFIGGSNRVASPEAIDRIEENNKIRELEVRLYNEFLEQEDAEIKKYFDEEISKGVNFDKLLHVHNAGITFNQRYAMYKASKAVDIEKELTKSNA